MAKEVPTSLPLMSIDAFTSTPFSGNGAAICPVEFHQHIPDDLKQKIAAEINLSETAYVQALSADSDFRTGSRFGLRWFTPTNEVPLCGHATLAAAAALFKCMGNTSDVLTFETLSGDLLCRRDGDQILMDLPLNKPVKDEDASLKALIRAVVGDLNVVDVYYSATLRKLLVRLDDKYSRSDLESVQPDFTALQQAHDGSKVKGVILCLKGGFDNCCMDKDGYAYDFVSRYFAPWNGIDEDPVTGPEKCRDGPVYDFLSRFFAPWYGVPEDPVTGQENCNDGPVYDFLSRFFAPWHGVPEDPVCGSAHTVLAPYWQEKLGKSKFYARQCSPRGGDLHVTVRDDGRVDVAGHSAVVIQGRINVQ